MKPATIPLALSLLLGATAHADPAVFRDGRLLISEGIAVRAEGDTYYRNITLQAQPDGGFRVVAAEPRNLAVVTELELTVIETAPVRVQLIARGTKHVPCVDIERPAVARVGNTFHVAIAETRMDPLALCAQVVAPFEVKLELDVRGLDAGDYLVVVNGMETDFTLDFDQ